MVELVVEAHQELALLFPTGLWVQELPLEQTDVEGWLDVVLVFHDARSRFLDGSFRVS